MAKKMNFDFKQFLLEKGERFGLGLAVGITALLIVLGVWIGLGKSSPLPDLEKNTKTLNDKVATTTPPPEVVNAKNITPPRPETGLDPKHVEDTEWAIRVNLEDDKKRNPQALGLVEDETGRVITQVDVVRAPVPVIDFVPGEYLNTLSNSEQKPDPGHPAQKLRAVHMIVVSAAFPYDAQVAAFRRALQVKKGEELKKPPQFLGFKIYRRDTDPDGKVSQDALDLEGETTSPFRKLLGQTVKLAPWNKNLQRVAYPGLVMPLPALAEGASYPPLTLKKKNKKRDKEEYLLPTVAPKKKKDDDEEKKEEPGTKRGSGRAIATLKWDTDDDDAWPEGLKEKLTGKSIKVFDPDAGVFGDPSQKDKGGYGQPGFKRDMKSGYPDMRQGQKGRKKKKGEEEVKSPNALFRFVDIEVKPGHSYEYLLVIRVANPNYNKPEEVADEREAEVKELVSKVQYIPPVKVPIDVDYYAVDEQQLQVGYGREKNPAMVGAEPKQFFTAKPKAFAKLPGGVVFNEEVAVQIHRWVGQVRSRKNFDLGFWLIAERLLLSRGEYIARQVPLQIPRWNQFEEQFEVLGKTTQSKKRARKAVVDFPEIEFSTQTKENARPAMLVDYYGGHQIVKVPHGQSQTTITDDSAAELLVITPDGKVRVRDGREDSDPDKDRGSERLERYQDWKKWIKSLTEEKDDKKDPKKRGKPGYDK